MEKRPSTRIRIGVTGPDRGGYTAWFATRLAIWRAGGSTFRITPRRPGSLQSCQALIIGGGADVGLQKGESIIEEDEQPDIGLGRRIMGLIVAPLIFLARLLFGKRQSVAENEARDRLELDCFEQARERRMPVLGICRGAQLINVALGGRLQRDLSDYYEEGDAIRSVLPRKIVLLDNDSRLARVFGSSRCAVNALHNQAIDADQLGSGLRVCGRESNGIVQAIETGTEWPVIGVQWHPEYMPQLSEQQRLFHWLIRSSHR